MYDRELLRNRNIAVIGPDIVIAESIGQAAYGLEEGILAEIDPASRRYDDVWFYHIMNGSGASDTVMIQRGPISEHFTRTGYLGHSYVTTIRIYSEKSAFPINTFTADGLSEDGDALLFSSFLDYLRIKRIPWDVPEFTEYDETTCIELMKKAYEKEMSCVDISSGNTPFRNDADLANAWFDARLRMKNEPVELSLQDLLLHLTSAAQSD